LYHEKHYKHGSAGSLSDEVDFLIFDEDNLPYALWEVKAPNEFLKKESDAIKYQLFGTATLVGVPKYLVYATILPKGVTPIISLKCIDYTEIKTYESWIEEGSPSYNNFPIEYKDLNYDPLKNGSKTNDLKTDCTQADFRAAAATFHNEFFGEHPDNILFVNLVKCLLAKIYDERTTQKNEFYKFQVFQKNGKTENAEEVFSRINNELYSEAYRRWIDPEAKEIDDINPREFSPERVKTIVKVLQSMSITKGASIHGDVIGAFFEEILRFGFKQDSGMYFTHDNIVNFMLHVVDIQGLTDSTWSKATHPENRLPYVIDPACGSGTFLLKAMNTITSHIKTKPEIFKTDLEAEEFFNARLLDSKPNYWAENFIYGMDPKFIMAITAKVNMVLHGDGSAHIYKYDAFKDFNNYDASKLRVAPDNMRTIPRSRYNFDTTETFDLVISNPPFGVTLNNETKSKLSKVFSLKDSLPSEALFIERCFQLLKPNGRLAIVLPESIINASDNIDIRLFIFRTFKIKSIVSLPRNIFKDTPTLTSSLFAQKKTNIEIEAWDQYWDTAKLTVDQKIKQVKSYLNSASKDNNETITNIKTEFMKILYPIVNKKDWFLKRGKNASVEKLNFGISSFKNKEEVVEKCLQILKIASFKQALDNYCFIETAKLANYKFPVYIVDEIGYKLSNRKEKSRPNQLCKFIGTKSKKEKPNLHLMDEDFHISINSSKPKTVLDHIKKSVLWD